MPRGAVRYRGAYGGRGSAKSFNFAKMSAVFGYMQPTRVLCTREIQESIKQSFHAEIKRAIASEPWLAAFYDVGEGFIRGMNGTEYIFKGLRNNSQSIKSTSGVGVCIVEEAEDVPEKSWRDLIPTVRDPGSEIWVIWNPCTEGSPVDVRFRRNVDKDMAICEMNYRDNPWFPEVLEQERRRDQRNCDPGVYAHIWEGAYLTMSDSQVLNGKWRVDEFTPSADWDGPYYGADWGFANDPLAFVRLWIHDDRLFVEHEAGGVGIDIDDIPALFRTIPGAEDHIIRGDGSRPETISYLRRFGYPLIRAAEGWPGSVEDGIAFLRSFDKIVIHPRCGEVIKEARAYSYKRDRLTGDVLPVIIDAHNHYMDAMRYALEPLIKNHGSGKISVAGSRIFSNTSMRATLNKV